MQTNTTTIIVIAVYFTVLLGIGFLAGRKVKGSGDYALGGRRVPGWAAALSERATDCSAWLGLGLPGSAYMSGLCSIWTAVGCLIGSAGVWFFIVNGMRKDSAKLGAMTYIDWISRRHSKKKMKIQVFGGLTIAFFFIMYVAAQFIGGGNTLNSLLGWEPIVGIIVTAVIVIPYTLYGGFGSVVYTDCLQAIMLMLLLLVVPIAGLFYAANNPDLVYAANLAELFVKADPSWTSLSGGAGGLLGGIVIGNGLAWCFAYLGGLPQLNARFMCIRDEGNFKSGRVISVSYIVLSYVGAIMLGIVGLLVLGPGLANGEQVTPTLALTIFPNAFGVLLVVGVIAAMLSTADSLLVLASTEVAESIVKPRMKGKNLGDKQYLAIARWVTLGISVLAFIMVFVVSGNFINRIVSWVWAGLGSPFAVCTVLTLFWKKYTDAGALWTIIVGMFFTIFWIVCGLDSVVTSMFTGVVAALITGVIVSLCTQPKPEDKQAENAPIVS